MLNLLDSLFDDIASNSGLKPKIKLTDEALLLAEALEEIGYIHSQKPEGKYIRVITKKTLEDTI